VDSEHCKVRDVLFVACSVFQHFSSSTSPRMSRKPSTRLRRLLLATFFEDQVVLSFFCSLPVNFFLYLDTASYWSFGAWGIFPRQHRPK